MILKCEKYKEARWKIFDEVQNPTYGYYSMSELDTILKREGFPESREFRFIDSTRKGNFMLIEFWSRGEFYIIATNGSCYLMNDKGETIENLRY